jgi:hypothetical protein
MRRAALLVCFALMEAALCAPLIYLLVPLPLITRLGAIFILLILFVGIAALWRWFAMRGVSPHVQMATLGALLFVLILVTELLQARSYASFELVLIELLPGFVVALALWWRGVSLGRSELNFMSATQHVQFGAFVMLLYGLSSGFAPNNHLLDSVIPFFAAATLAMPLAHLESVQLSSAGHRVRMSFGWWRSSAVIMLMAAALSAVLVSLISGTPLVYIALGAIGVIVLPIAFVLAYLFSQLLNGVQWQFNMPSFPNFTELDFGNANTDGVLSNIHIPPQVNTLIAVIVLGAVGALALLLMGHARRLSHERTIARDSYDVAHENEAARESRLDALRNTFNVRRWLAEITIRRLYARMTHEATKRGFARKVAQTPTDYLAQLYRAFPHSQPEAQLITDAYIAAHYGEVPDDEHALKQLRAAWERLRVKR